MAAALCSYALCSYGLYDYALNIYIYIYIHIYIYNMAYIGMANYLQYIYLWFI